MVGVGSVSLFGRAWKISSKHGLPVFLNKVKIFSTTLLLPYRENYSGT